MHVTETMKDAVSKEVINDLLNNPVRLSSYLIDSYQRWLDNKMLHSSNAIFKELNIKICNKDIGICMITDFLSKGVNDSFCNVLRLTTTKLENLRTEWRSKRQEIIHKY